VRLQLYLSRMWSSLALKHKLNPQLHSPTSQPVRISGSSLAVRGNGCDGCLEQVDLSHQNVNRRASPPPTHAADRMSHHHQGCFCLAAPCRISILAKIPAAAHAGFIVAHWTGLNELSLHLWTGTSIHSANIPSGIQHSLHPNACATGHLSLQR